MDAFVAAQTLINDFEARLRLTILTANEPFLFYTGVGEKYYTGVLAWSLKGFLDAVAVVDAAALEFHIGNGDFENWVRCSLRDSDLADQIKALTALKGEALRKTLALAVKQRFSTQTRKLKDALQLS